MHRIIAIIPARGGSKRFPRKNIVLFGGREIIGWTIEEARGCGIFQRVVVSTEDAEIAEVAGKFGVEVDARPERLGGDDVGLAEVCLEFLEREARSGREYDIMCCLFPAAPLRKAKDIVGTVDLVRTGECDFAVAVTDYHFPPHMAKAADENGYLRHAWPEWAAKKRRELPRMVIDNGSTYAFSVPAFLKAKTFHGSPQKGYHMPRMRSVDIDEPEDLRIAELFAEATR